MSSADARPHEVDDRRAYDAWRRRVEEESGGAGLAPHRTLDGLDLEPLYAASLPAGYAAAAGGAGLPGERPFTRGSPAAGEGWLRCARCEAADPETANSEIVADLAGGIGGIWLGLGDDANGGGIATAADLDRALRGVRLDEVTLGLDAGADALPAAALALAVCRRRDLDPAALRTHFEADPLAAVARHGVGERELPEILRQAAVLAVYCRSHLPGARALVVSTEPYHEAGATATRELGYALASGVRYLRLLAAAGLEPAAAARQIGFRLPVGRDVFLTVAKLRAVRAGWDRVLEACGVEAPPAPWIHAVASRRAQARRAAWTNLLRATSATFAAAAGGADAVTCLPHDAPLGPPKPLARRLARNVQAILAEESGLGRVADPAGGSYFLEALTRDLAAAGWRVLQEVERDGGMERHLLSGAARRAVEGDWRRRRARIADRSHAVTGVSWFAEIEEEGGRRTEAREGTSAAAKPRPAPAAANPRLAAALAAEDLAGAIEELVERAGRGARLGQLAAALRGASEPAPRDAAWPRRRDGGMFERLQDHADALAAGPGRPVVWLIELGERRHHRERAQFARRALRAGGFAVEGRGGGALDTARLGELLRAAAGAEGVRAACLCGSDAAYRELAAALPALSSRADELPVLVAGDAPGEAGSAAEKPPAGLRRLAPGVDLHALLAELLGLDPEEEDEA